MALLTPVGNKFKLVPQETICRIRKLFWTFCSRFKTDKSCFPKAPHPLGDMTFIQCLKITVTLVAVAYPDRFGFLLPVAEVI